MNDNAVADYIRFFCFGAMLTLIVKTFYIMVSHSVGRALKKSPVSYFAILIGIGHLIFCIAAAIDIATKIGDPVSVRTLMYALAYTSSLIGAHFLHYKIREDRKS